MNVPAASFSGRGEGAAGIILPEVKSDVLTPLTRAPPASPSLEESPLRRPQALVCSRGSRNLCFRRLDVSCLSISVNPHSLPPQCAKEAGLDGLCHFPSGFSLGQNESYPQEIGMSEKNQGRLVCLSHSPRSRVSSLFSLMPSDSLGAGVSLDSVTLDLNTVIYFESDHTFVSCF